ncbi:MAG TPA: aromatic amino acid lyase [Acidimicrobiales bacterium]|nr:aromatic amino acid lyase [Acidimicrobiales bacterium]
MPDEPVVLRPGGLSRDEVMAVARGGARAVLSDEAVATMAATRAHVDALAAADQPVYGISTGFGGLATTHIPPGERARMQRSLVVSHAAGMGAPVEPEVVRATVLLRARTMATGITGARPDLARALLGLLDLDDDALPVVPEFGSLGCSGDLAPLAHVAAALDLPLAAKEGLALVNGTDGMLAMLVLACADLAALARVADVAAAMSVEGLLGTDRPFAADLVALRPHPGQQASAANIAALLAGSRIVASHRSPATDPRVQDAYSLRCAPQVHGATRDALAFAEACADRELASAIDNPVVIADGRVESVGNFHGAPLAHACDLLAIVVADVAAMSERRTDRFLDAARSHGLPPFLAHEPGVDSGLMIAQYTAAALVAECRRLAVPASVDSIPTSAMQEDHVSMGWAAARKLRTALAHLGRVLAVELVTAARGIDLRAPLPAAPGTGAARDALRAGGVGGPGPDRMVAPELEAAAALVADGTVLRAVEQEVGPLA